MSRRREYRAVPWAFADAIRGTISSTIAVVIVIALGVVLFLTDVISQAELLSSPAIALALVCGAWTLFAAIYLLWTRALYTRASDEEIMRISRVLHHDRPDLTDHLVGLGSGGTGTVSAAMFALITALGAALLGPEAPWIMPIALVTVASAWLTMAYAFALTYLRLSAAGERITFDIDEEPRFGDFLSMSLMVSCVGALSAGTPRTRAALRAVRTHTVFAFVFNAFIVAMTVSLVVGFVTS